MGPVERVLLIRLSALGDVVLLSPAIRALRQAHPGVSVDLVTDARYAAFAATHMELDKVVGYDRHGAHAGYAGVGQVQALLPQEPYDAVVDLQGKLRTRVLARRIRAKQHLVLQKRSLGQALLSVIGHDPPIADRRAAALYVQALLPLGVDPEASLQTHLKPLPQQARGPGLRVGLSVGASHATKRWGPERFVQLAEALRARYPDAVFVVVGGPADREILSAVQDGLPVAWRHPQDVSELGVLALAELIAGLDLMVSVDTGPAHLSAAFAVPTVVLFGPTSAARWGPVGPVHRTVSLGLDCSPCSNTGGERCPRPDRNHACMKDLAVQDVLPVCLEALGGAQT